jgi:hypothetical protein
MKPLLAVVGGLVFIASLLYFVWSFAWRFGETTGPWSFSAAQRPIAIDIVLFSLFALHHSVFARYGLKAWIAARFPDLERSLYVWIASLAFIAVCALWQPVPGLTWTAPTPLALAFSVVQAAAAVFTVASARGLGMLDLAGVRQTLPGRPAAPGLYQRGPYSLVRHPIYLGWFFMVWLPPVMNGTRLLFAIVSCAYLVIAVPWEERELRRAFGDVYTRYEHRVRWRVLPLIY